MAAYRRAIRLDSDWAGFHYGLGNAYRRLGRHEESLVSSRRAVELDPDDAAFHLGLAGVYRYLGDEVQAQHHLAGARRLTKPDDRYNLACLESIAGDVEAAPAYLEQALEKTPGYRDLACRDPNLNSIRDDAHFQASVGEE